MALLCLGWMVSLAIERPVPPGASSADLQKVIAQLDAAAAKFLSAQADFTWDQSRLWCRNTMCRRARSILSAKRAGPGWPPTSSRTTGRTAPKTVLFDGGEAEFYEPTIKQLTVIRAGANRSQWESFLTLGFGGSGTDLEANWKVACWARRRWMESRWPSWTWCRWNRKSRTCSPT